MNKLYEDNALGANEQDRCEQTKAEEWRAAGAQLCWEIEVTNQKLWQEQREQQPRRKQDMER